jgi:hypothetical protein
VPRASPGLLSAAQIISEEVHLLNAHRRQVMAMLRKIIEIQRQSELIINIFAQNLGVGLT